MTTPDRPTPPDLQSQVSSAADAVQRDAAAAAERAKPVAPPDRRPLAAVAVLALALTLWLSMDRLRGGEPDRAVLRDGMRDGVAFVAQMLIARHDSTGTLPASLAELGLGDLPLTYTPSPTGFRLVGVTETGDTITYESPALPAREDRP